MVVRGGGEWVFGEDWEETYVHIPHEESPWNVFFN